MLLYQHLVGRTFKFHRTLVSRLDSMPSGTVDGSCTFKALEHSITPDLLYAEEGVLRLPSSLTPLTVSQRYIYSFPSNDSHLDIHFVKRNSQERDYIFLSLALTNTADRIESCDTHLCINDLYKASFTFHGLDPHAEEVGEGFGFRIVYDVKGPAKDYTSDTTYSFEG